MNEWKKKYIDLWNNCRKLGIFGHSSVHMLVLRGWYAFEGPQRACDGLGPLRVSESLRKPWKAQKGLKGLENTQNGLGVVGYYFQIFLEFSEALNLKLSGTESTTKCLEDEWKDMKKSSRVLQDIVSFRAAALHCITKNDKFKAHRCAMNTWVWVYNLHYWSRVPKLSECKNWSKNEILFLLP